MSVAVCLLVKNEVDDIAEWVAHYSLLGFDQLIIYDNCSTDGTTDLIARLATEFPVSHRLWPDERARLSSCKQMAAYEHCLREDGPSFDWLAFLDADEFLIPPAGRTISDLLEARKDSGGLAINWQIFGSSGLSSTQGRLVMEAFDRRAATSYKANRHVKMIFQPRAAVRILNPHYVLLDKPIVSVEGREMTWSQPGITAPEGIVSGAWKLNHYIIRSRQHWERRILRGQADVAARDWTEFHEFDRNEVLDPGAYQQAARVRELLESQGFSYAPVPTTAEDLRGPAADQVRPNFGRARQPAGPSIVLVFDGVHAHGHVHGWAHDPLVPGSSVVVTPLIDGLVCQPVICDRSRPDVLASAIGKEHVGFRFDIDPTFLDGEEHVLSFQDNAGNLLPLLVDGRPRQSHLFRQIFTPSIFSAIDGMQNSVLRGWVACRRRPQGELDTSCDVLITVNGLEIATAVADRPRPDVGAALRCASTCGFSVPIPAAYRTAIVQEFRFFLMPERLELQGSPMITSFAQHDHAMKLTGVLEYMDEIVAKIDAFRKVVSSVIPSSDLDLHSYDLWQRRAALRLRQQVLDTRGLVEPGHRPLVSVVCPVYKPDMRDFGAAIRSVMDQTYTNWELILVDDGSHRPSLTESIARFKEQDPRIRSAGDGENRGISGATNLALAAARGEWIAFFDHDDLLVDVALECLIQQANLSGAKLLYSDEDKIDEFGFFSEPALKPDWNYRYLLSVNYVNHLTMVKTDLVRKVGFLDPALDGAQDHDFLLRLAEQLDSSEIKHVPEVLYHWRKAAQSTALLGATKSYAVDAGIRAIGNHLERVQKPATVSSVTGGTLYRVNWKADLLPSVTIIIPFKDKIAMTMRCVDHIRQYTKGTNWNVVLVDNGSVEEETLSQLQAVIEDPRIAVLRIDEEFNYSRLNNLAAQASDSEYFVFMNNDLFVQDDDWLPLLMNEALIDPSVGAVGGKFLFENRTIQHSGVVLGLGGVAGHVFVGEAEASAGYGSRAILAHEVSAVTAACVLVRGSVFRMIGGFDEVGLKVAFNDIDLCLRIRDAGYRIIMNPDFVAEHHESISRGSEDKPEKVERFQRETAFMKDRWGVKLTSDPFYNKNFSLEKRPYVDLSSVS